MITNFQKVRDFNIAFGIGRSKTPDDKLKKLRWDLIREESDELIDAIKTKNFTEIIDAVSDILYVIHGAADSFDQDFDKYLDANIVETENKNVDMFISNDIKTKTNLSERMTAIFESVTPVYEIFMTKHEKEMETLQTLLFGQDSLVENIMTQLAVLHNLMYNFANIFGFNLDDTFDMVHNSNMSKLAETEEVAKETVQWYLENEKRYDSPAYRLSTVKVNDEPRWVIYNQNTGKALKSIHYFPVDFTPLF
jgi:predicted HAD superfamily Cof-like phosphohydrolase